MFQSTRPSRGATAAPDDDSRFVFVSIHAPLAGRDAHRPLRLAALPRFNPRAPRGARPGLDLREPEVVKFQSTRPSRGATQIMPESVWDGFVSIHAPLAGRDGDS